MPKNPQSGIITEQDVQLWTEYVHKDIPTRKIKEKISRIKVYKSDQIRMCQRLEQQVKDMEREIKNIYSQISRIKSKLPALDLQLDAEKAQLSMRKRQLYPVFIAHLYRTNFLKVQMAEDGIEEGMGEPDFNLDDDEVCIEDLPDDL